MLHNEVNALVVAPENPEGLATCIKRLQVDPELRNCLAEVGRQMVLGVSPWVAWLTRWRLGSLQYRPKRWP